MRRQPAAVAFPTRRGPGGGYLCAFCRAPLAGRRRRNCGDACMAEVLLRSGDPAEMKRQVYARDRGVCASCGVDCDRIAQALAPLYRPPYQATSTGGRVNVNGWIGEPRPARGRWGTWFELADHLGRLALRLARLRGENPRWWQIRRAITDHPGYDRHRRAQLRDVVARLRRAFVARRDALGWASAGHTWEVDHKVPVERGGAEDLKRRGLAACQTLCLPCHKMKTAAEAAERAARAHTTRYRRLRADRFAPGEQLTLEGT